MVKRTGTGALTNFELYSGNKMYEGGDNGTSIGFFTSSSVTANDAIFTSTTSITIQELDGSTYTGGVVAAEIHWPVSDVQISFLPASCPRC